MNGVTLKCGFIAQLTCCNSHTWVSHKLTQLGEDTVQGYLWYDSLKYLHHILFVTFVTGSYKQALFHALQELRFMKVHMFLARTEIAMSAKVQELMLRE